jgi:four helix bundle protein
MKSYRDLEIFICAKSLAVEVHEVSLNLPKFELYEEGSQVRRSSKAVASMILEGYGRRRYKADFIKHLVYAHTECDETLFHIQMLIDTKSLVTSAHVNSIIEAYEKLSKQINAFIAWVEKHWKT